MKPISLYSPEPARGWMPPGWLAPILTIPLVAVPFALSMLVLIPSGLVDKEGDPFNLPGWGAFLILAFGLIGLVFLGWARLVEKRPLATIGLTGAQPVRSFATGLAFGSTGILAIVAAIWLSGGFHVGAPFPAFASPKVVLGIFALLPCFALQSSVEEIIFRGWLLSGVARKFGTPLAVLLSSAVFSLMHFEPGQNWATYVAIALFALFACAWALRSGNIWGVMGWHAAWNWLCAVGFELPVTGMNINTRALLVKLTPIGSPLLTGGPQGPEGSLWCSAFFVVAIALVARGLRADQSESAASAASASSSVQRA